MARAGIYPTLRDAYLRFERNDGSAMAGYIAFSALLAVFPFLIFAVAFAGTVIGAERSQQAVDALFQFLPDHVALTLEPVLFEVLQDRGQGIWTFSFLAAIWIASNALEAFRTAFDRAYDVEETRSFFLRRAIAIGFVFVGGAVAVILGVSIIFTPLLIQAAEGWLKFAVPYGTTTLSFLLGFAVFLGFLTALHRFLPGRSMAGEAVWPGVLSSALLWLVVALGFSFYLSLAPSYTITYGALSGVVVTLLFFYLSGVVVIFGAELNATLAGRATSNPT
ncbi:MAG TPA: YihY/virulence factor BrkB family protein [Paracoccaceae bacterium]|nr:YihY/virulence factor BrkB family protein [Paracoccaceae bacterium]